jgi:hypothetical protein
MSSAVQATVAAAIVKLVYCCQGHISAAIREFDTSWWHKQQLLCCHWLWFCEIEIVMF